MISPNIETVSQTAIFFQFVDSDFIISMLSDR